MKITPVEITNKDFKRTMRGYSTDEVDEFLDEIVEDFEALYRENAGLKEKIDAYNEKIGYYSSLEKTLQNTLVLAQNTADATKLQAEREAEHILEQAKSRAVSIMDEANKENERMLREYEKTRMDFKNFRLRILNFMESQISTFQSSAEGIEKGDLGTRSLKVSGLQPGIKAESPDRHEEPLKIEDYMGEDMEIKG